MGKVETKPPSAGSETSVAVVTRILNECQHSQGVHARRAKELVAWRSEHREGFLTDLWKCLLPLFTVFKREPAVERLVKFVVTFVTLRDEKHGGECDAFLEEFFGLLLFSTDATNKVVRLRACQILSEVILRLNEDAEVSDEVWDDVIESMHRRMQDKVPAIRVYSARALARFASADGSDDPEDDAILSAYRRSLQLDQNAEVRRNIILSMPPSNATVHDIVRHTADVSEAVRRTAFFVLAKKFPIQSLSIKQRTGILQRGLHDRKEAVQVECLKMLKDVWLVKCCQGDLIALLKYLDVETNESVGESVMLALLREDAIKVQDGQGLRKFTPNTNAETEGGCNLAHLMEAEEALYWRLYISYLHSEAQAKGHDAATTGGAQAAINAAAATEKNELLDRVLPSTMAEYVHLVKAHLNAGPHLHFVSRQLLLIGKFLDFSDATNRKVAGTFLQDIMCLPAGHFEDDEVLLGDGLSLGGDKYWSKAVAELAWKVHGAPQEFVKMISEVVAELGRPCREGGASIMQWVTCLAATGFMLENIESLNQLTGHAIEAHELLGGLLLPAAKHIHPEVQRAAVRSLGLFCAREPKPSLQAVKQLRLALTNGISILQKMASKALFDLCMWHGAAVVDRAIGLGIPSQEGLIDDGALKGDNGLPTLDLLAQKLDADDTEQESMVQGEAGDAETVQSIIAEGFAKLLLQSKVFSDILPLQHSVFAKVLRLYFNEETKSVPRLRQCLAVFFETYPSISLDHKSCIAKSFIPVMRAEWPGIYGNESGTQATVATKKRHATKLSKFMLQLLHQPLFEGGDPSSRLDDKGELLEQENCTSAKEQLTVTVFDEELAIRIAAEVVGFPSQRSAAAKSYLVMLTKTLCSIDFRQSEQQLIKCMRRLLDNMKDSVMGDKQASKELDNMAMRLRDLDNTPEDALSDEQLQITLCNMELEEFRLGQVDQQEVEAKTPAPAAANRGRARRAKRASTPESCSSSPSPVANTPGMPPTTVRAQRASKTAAMGKMRSELAPSKRAIYASSEEDLVSSSSSDDDQDGDKANETDSEFEVSVQQACVDESEPAVLLERTNCSAPNAAQGQKAAESGVCVGSFITSVSDESEVNSHAQAISKGRRCSRGPKKEKGPATVQGNLIEEENAVSVSISEERALSIPSKPVAKAGTMRRNLRLNRNKSGQVISSDHHATR